MFWPDISPSLQGTKSSVCHCEPVEGRRGNLNYSKERYVWAQVGQFSMRSYKKGTAHDVLEVYELGEAEVDGTK